MRALNISLSDEEYAFVKSKPRGWVRAVIAAQMRPRPRWWRRLLS